METRKEYGRPDNGPHISADRGFAGFKSNIKANILKEGELFDSRNARIENGEIETRKGSNVVYIDDENFEEVFASCRYINPVAGGATNSAIAMALTDKLRIYDPEDGDYTVPYQSGQTAQGDAELVESFGSLILYRGRGVTLPTKLPFTLGEYPLIFNGQTPAEGGLFKMPNAVVVIQIYAHTRTTTQLDVDEKYASEVGVEITETRADLAPIESLSETWTFDGNISMGGTAGMTTGHEFVTDDTIKLQGTRDYDGVYKIRKVDFNTVILIDFPVPSAPLERNTKAIGWKETSYLSPADYAVTTANRLAFQSGPDTVQFSDAFAPTIVNPFFNKVLVNEGAGDFMTALLPVQDDSLLVFKRSSIYLITATTTLGDNLRVIEVTRQLGCIARGSVQQIGGLVYFLSDDGVFAVDSGIRQESNIASPITALQIIDVPTSEPIQNHIKKIDFAYADKFISAYHDNRYYLGVVTKESAGEVNQVLIYNQLLKNWESIDTVAENLVIKDFVVCPVNGTNTMHAVCSNSQILSLETNESGIDNYYDTANELSADPINWSITTRSYDADSFNIKRWHRIGIAVRKLTTEETGVSFGFGTNNPDTAKLAYSVAPIDQYRKTYRVICRARGQLFHLTVTNKLNRDLSGGRLRISEIYAESSEVARSSKMHSLAVTGAGQKFDVIKGNRPGVNDVEDPLLVGDATVDNEI